MIPVALPDSGSINILHTFTGAPGDGSVCESSVILDSNENLYGVTQRGGAFGFGTVFMISH